MQKRLGQKNVVLLGIGHSNAHVLRMWKMNPRSDAELICVSDFPVVTYSGMLPGVLAGQYDPSAMEIDLIRMASSVAARVIVDQVTGLDREHRTLLFAQRPPLPFDILSIGIGSRPKLSGIAISTGVRSLAIKPMQTFLDRLASQLLGISRQASRPKIAIVGGGVGSIEIAFCLYERFFGSPKFESQGDAWSIKPELSLLTGADEIGTGLRSSTIHKILIELSRRKISVLKHSRVIAAGADGLVLDNGQHVEADLIIWATSAVGSPLLSQLGLETDEHGFISTAPDLQSITLPGVFAVGDSGTIMGSTISKAGVYAVRQGPVLFDNIRRLLNGQPLQRYYPQTDFLKLVNLGNGRAIAECKGRSFSGRWCWTLKNYIDVKFMRKYQSYQPMDLKISGSADGHPMRCLGCGGKLSGQLLEQVLADFPIASHPDVQLGLSAPDDAAIIITHDNQVTVTNDFFAAPFDDPYLVGRIAALNSASDCFVMGAQPTAALAMVQIPEGPVDAQTRLMKEVMFGCLEEFNRMNVALVGGHSIEGPRLMVGFTVLGRQIVPPHTKGCLKPDDVLITTKRLGTGILLAAWMQAKLSAPWHQPLLDSMLSSNQIALELVQKFEITALTDVTGFGLAGHLSEMLQASRIGASIVLDQIPLLPGCRQLVEQGIKSTLADANRDNNVVLRPSRPGVLDSPILAPIFDPQTGGGLLFGIPSHQAASSIEFLQSKGFPDAAIIGQANDGYSNSVELQITG